MRFDDRHSLLLGALLVVGTLVYGVLIVTSGPRPVGGEGRRLYVDLKSTGNLEVGAPLRRSGVEIGRVVALRKEPHPGEPPRKAPLRLVLWVEQAKAHLVPRTAELYIASPSPLGKRHVEVGLPPRPSDPASRRAAFTAAPAEHVFRGVDPPLLDRLVNVGWRSFGELWAFVREQTPAVSKLTAGLDRLRARLETLSLERRIPLLARKLEVLVAEARGLVAMAKPRIAAGKRSAARLVTTLGSKRRERLGRLVTRADTLAKRLRTLSKLIGPAQRQRLTRIAARIRQTRALFEGGAGKLRALLAGLKRGRGTLGRLLNDRELNSDLKASHKALKSAPWRVLRLPPRRQAPRRRPPKR